MESYLIQQNLIGYQTSFRIAPIFASGMEFMLKMIGTAQIKRASLKLTKSAEFSGGEILNHFSCELEKYLGELPYRILYNWSRLLIEKWILVKNLFEPSEPF